jgi:hypothetical protein
MLLICFQYNKFWNHVSYVLNLTSFEPHSLGYGQHWHWGSSSIVPYTIYKPHFYIHLILRKASVETRQALYFGQ